MSNSRNVISLETLRVSSPSGSLPGEVVAASHLEPRYSNAEDVEGERICSALVSRQIRHGASAGAGSIGCVGGGVRYRRFRTNFEYYSARPDHTGVKEYVAWRPS